MQSAAMGRGLAGAIAFADDRDAYLHTGPEVRYATALVAVALAAA